MLISFKVEKLVISAIPDLVETWTKGFGFIPVSKDEKRSLNKINFMVFPGTILLKKQLFNTKEADTQSGECLFPFQKKPRLLLIISNFLRNQCNFLWSFRLGS